MGVLAMDPWIPVAADRNSESESYKVTNVIMGVAWRLLCTRANVTVPRVNNNKKVY